MSGQHKQPNLLVIMSDEHEPQVVGKRDDLR
jgi:hypothetical protein